MPRVADLVLIPRDATELTERSPPRLHRVHPASDVLVDLEVDVRAAARGRGRARRRRAGTATAREASASESSG